MESTLAVAANFLESVGMHPRRIDAGAVLERFLSDMRKGLQGDDPSLAMLPTYVDPTRPIPPEKPVIVLDAGGTNLRVCRVTFDTTGRSRMEAFQTYPMPGAEHELSADEFFGRIADYLEPVMDDAVCMGFCFSYPAEILPDRDAKLIYWTKEIKVPDVVGTRIGEGLLQVLDARSMLPPGGLKVTVLNDTVAAILAGRGDVSCDFPPERIVGFILGTGSNTAYVEKNANIGKLDMPPNGEHQVVNVESGNFSGFPRGVIDERLDRKTNSPGRYFMEKATAGVYLGALGLELLKAAAEDNLFSSPARDAVLAIPALSTKEMSEFLAGDVPLPGVAGALNRSERDTDLARELLGGLIARSAALAAIHVAAPVLKAVEDYPSGDVCIHVDGSTFYKTFGYREQIEENLRAILAPRGIRPRILISDNAPVIGAAIAGLIGG